MLGVAGRRSVEDVEGGGRLDEGCGRCVGGDGDVVVIVIVGDRETPHRPTDGRDDDILRLCALVPHTLPFAILNGARLRETVKDPVHPRLHRVHESRGLHRPRPAHDTF